MKKVLPLLVLASACLASCGESSYYGSYKFLMGRQGEGETRVSVEMTLKEDKFVIPEKNKEYYEAEDIEKIQSREQFHASFEMSGNASENDSDKNSAIENLQGIMVMGDLLGDLVSDIDIDGAGIDDSPAISTETENIQLPEIDPNKPIELDGFYNVLDDLVDEKYGKKVQLGIDSGFVNPFLKDAGFEITDVVSNFVVAYVNQKQMTLQMPISLDDIQMQLAWYGTYIDYDPYLREKVNTLNDLLDLIKKADLETFLDTVKVKDLTAISSLPGEADWNKRYGSHPVVEYHEDKSIKKSEIEEMNNKYKGIFSNTFVYENNEGVIGEKIGSIYKEDGENLYFYPFGEPLENGIHSVILKQDIGILDYDFSKDVVLNMQIFKEPYEGEILYHCDLKTLADEEVDVKSFYKKPFVFRDFHDIKVNLAKEK